MGEEKRPDVLSPKGDVTVEKGVDDVVGFAVEAEERGVGASTGEAVHPR